MKGLLSFVVYIFLVCLPITGVTIILSALMEKAFGYPIGVTVIITGLLIIAGGALAGWLWSKLEEKFFS